VLGVAGAAAIRSWSSRGWSAVFGSAAQQEAEGRPEAAYDDGDQGIVERFFFLLRFMAFRFFQRFVRAGQKSSVFLAGVEV